MLSQLGGRKGRGRTRRWARCHMLRRPPVAAAAAAPGGAPLGHCNRLSTDINFGRAGRVRGCRGAQPPAGGARGGAARARGAARQRAPTRRRRERGRRCGRRGRAFPGHVRMRVPLREARRRAHTTARPREHRFRNWMQNRTSWCHQQAESYTGRRMRAILPCPETLRRAHPIAPRPDARDKTAVVMGLGEK